jgi:hypothetical protein
VSRRSLLRGGLAGGGIGLAVAAGAGAAVGITHNSSQTSLSPVSKPVVMAPMAPNATEGPLVVYISDSTSGVLDVFGGTGATLNKAGTPRSDLAAILLTGIPSGIVAGFHNYTGSVQADLMRLNTAIPASTNPNPLGIIGGDLAGFPNGRRLFDDVVSVEL